MPVIVTDILFYSVIIFAILAVAAHLHTRWSARKILNQQKAIYSGKMEYANASPDSFPWLDRSFYEDVTRKMLDAGYRNVGDFECLTASRQFPSMRTFVRSFTGDSGTTMSACFHVKMRGFMGFFALLGVIPKNLRTIEFETEFSDNTFLSTSNSLGLNAFTDFPGIVIQQLPPDASYEQILARHREKLRELVEVIKLQPVIVASAEEILASQDRMHELKSRHREKTGYVTREQFKTMAGGKLSDAQNELVDEFERAREEDVRKK